MRQSCGGMIVGVTITNDWVPDFPSAFPVSPSQTSAQWPDATVIN
jgi:hypothetical protein